MIAHYRLPMVRCGACSFTRCGNKKDGYHGCPFYRMRNRGPA